MRSENSLTDKEKLEHRFHYAALYQLFSYATNSDVDGNAILYLRKRWNPTKDVVDAEYESITFICTVDNYNYKFESWVIEHKLIILLTNTEGIIGLNPSENYHIDINDPRSIDQATIILQKHLTKGSKNFKNLKRSNLSSPKRVLTKITASVTTLMALLLIWRILIWLSTI